MCLRHRLSRRKPQLEAKAASHLLWAERCQPIALRMRVSSCCINHSPHAICALPLVAAAR